MAFLTIVGMGPGADSYLTLGAMAEIASGDLVVFRTTNHPSAASVLDSLAQSASPVFSFDLLYDRFDDFDTIYETMAKLIEGLVRQRVSIEDFAQSATLIHGKLELDELNKVVFVVPGSPNVAEASVRHLCEIFKDSIQVEAGVSFLDIAFSRLNRDPFESPLTLVDSTEFLDHFDRYAGDLLIGQVWSEIIAMSIADLLVGADKAYSMTYLYHLGLDDELVREIGLAEVSSLPFDHLTSLLLNDFTESSASAFTSLLEIVRELRVKCPWDANQDHQSLSKHLVEEAYEVVDAIDKFYSETSNSGALGDEFLSDHQIYCDEFGTELGDLVVQVFFHAVIAQEGGLFDMRFVLDAIRQKLIRRHPHVFGGLKVDGASEVASNWEKIKREEKPDSSPIDDIPSSLPGLLYAGKVIRKAGGFGFVIPEMPELVRSIRSFGSLEEFSEADLLELIFEIVMLSKAMGVDLESGLRLRARQFASQFSGDEAAE